MNVYRKEMDMEPRDAENKAQKSPKGYGRRPIWQWVVIYVIAAAIVYGLIYYLIFYKGNSY